MLLTSNSGWLTPTRLIGLSAYLFAAISCSIAWIRNRQTPHSSRLAALLTVLNAIFFLDIACDGRWVLHDLLQHAAIDRGLYGQRSGGQIAVLAIVGGALLVGLATARRGFVGRIGEFVAVCGALTSLSSWCVEIISLHAVDHVFYYTVGGIKLVSVLWIVCSLMTGLGILWTMRQSESTYRQV